MTPAAYRYEFGPGIPTEEAGATLLLSVIAAESLHGEGQVRLDAPHAFDPARRACAIPAGTPAGRDLNRLFAGFLAREFGPGSFRVETVPGTDTPEPAAP